MNAVAPLLEELNAITGYLNAARSIIHDGTMPDITALEPRIAEVCHGIQAAEFDEQSQCLPLLATLLKTLDECERDMRAWRAGQEKAKTP